MNTVNSQVVYFVNGFWGFVIFIESDQVNYVFLRFICLPIIVKIKKRTGDYAALLLAYSVARELSFVGTGVLSSARLNMALERSCRDLDQIKELEKHLQTIESGAKTVNKGAEQIRDLIQKTMESFNRTSQLLNNSINGEVISDEEWLAFFSEK